MKMSTICTVEKEQNNFVDRSRGEIIWTGRNNWVVHYLIDIGQRFGVVLNEHLSERDSLVGINTHDAAQQENIVRMITDFFGVQHDLLELVSLGETLNNLSTFEGGTFSNQLRPITRGSHRLEIVTLTLLGTFPRK